LLYSVCYYIYIVYVYMYKKNIVFFYVLYTQLISKCNILIRKVEIWYRKDQYDNVWFSTPVTIHSGLCSVTSFGVALCYCDNAVCQANVSRLIRLHVRMWTHRSYENGTNGNEYVTVPDNWLLFFSSFLAKKHFLH